MSIFNSLGSNYTFSSAWQNLCASGGKETQEELVAYLQKRYGGQAILTYKGREALQLALAQLPSTQKGVAVNGYTCYAVYKAIVDSGKTVEYLDISEHSLHFSPATLAKAIAKYPDLQAVIIQNTLGYPCEIGEIAALCRAHGLILIEDLAHSIGTYYASGEEAGTVGDMVILSFSQDKVVDAVSGGALIVRNGAFKPQSRLPLSSGKQRKDRWYPLLTVLIRSTHGLGVGKLLHSLCRTLHLLPQPLSGASEAQELPGWYCAVIVREYMKLDQTLPHKQRIVRIYRETLDKDLQRISDPDTYQQATCLRFPVLVTKREELIEGLRKKQVYVSDIWYDAPVAPKKYAHLVEYHGECPVAEKVAGEMINLPTHIHISAEQARELAEEINAWHKNTR